MPGIQKISERLENFSTSRPEERRTLSTSTVRISSGQNSTKLTEKSWERQEQRHGSSDEEMSRTGQSTAFRAQGNPWPFTSPLTGGDHSIHQMPRPYLSDWNSTATERSGTRPQGDGYLPFDPELLTSKVPWSTPSPVLYGRKDHGALELSCEFPRGYAAGYDLPRPLPDSPPLRRHGTYKEKGSSRLIAAAEGDNEMGEGGGPALQDRPEPTDEERLEQARDLYEQEQRRADRLEQELEALRLGQQPGRDPLRRRGPPTNRFSIPRPDDYEGPPTTGPSGTYNHDHPLPMSGVKPLLMEKPQFFEGAHEDIEHFIGDCQTYFETFRFHYRQHPALMVVFASSLFWGAAQDWWVHLQDEYEYTPEGTGDYDDNDEDAPFNGGPRYRFPNWEEFTCEVRKQFHDPAIELVHEKKMGELRMMGPTYLFFRQMEREAKLANRLHDQTERSVLVEAVRKGIPRSYSSIIADIGFAIPRTYPEWKTRVITMYEERTKDGVYVQTHFEPCRDDRKPPQYQKPNTATSSKPAAGGATSLSSAKQND